MKRELFAALLLLALLAGGAANTRFLDGFTGKICGQNATFSTEVLIIVLIVIQLNYFLSKLVDKLILLGSIS